MDFARERSVLMRMRAAVFCLVVFGALLPVGVGQVVAQEAAPAANVPGDYKDVADPDNVLTFYVTDGGLMMESDRAVPQKLKAFSANEFGMEKEKYRFRFAGSGADATLTILDEKGEAAQTFHRLGEPVKRVFHDYQRSEAMIPARDGVKLHVVILKPADLKTPLPFLIQRTPYGCDETNRASFHGGRPELAREGYIYVCGDIRGRYKSEGT